MATSLEVQPLSSAANPALAGSGSYAGFMGPGYQQFRDAIADEKDPFIKSYLWGQFLNDKNKRDFLQDLPYTIKTINDIQYANRLKARPLEFEELAAKYALGSLGSIPEKILAARHMYGREEASNFTKGLQAFSAAPVVPRYF